jgi:hypothetical protein
MDQPFLDSNADNDEEDEDSAHQANAFFQSLKPSSFAQAQPAEQSNNSLQLNATQPSDQTQPANQANAFFQSLKPPGSSQTQPAAQSNNPFPPITMQLSDQTQPANRTDDFFRSLRRSLASQDDSASAGAAPEIIPGLRSVLSRGQPTLMGQVNTSDPAAAGVVRAAAPTPEIIPGLRAAASPAQPGSNPQGVSPTAQQAPNAPSAGSPGFEDHTATPPATAPQTPPSPIVIGDDDIDRALNDAFVYIKRWQLEDQYFPAYYGLMEGLDTYLNKHQKDFFTYNGDKYPLLKGRTFSGPDLNYLGIGAGFAAGGYPKFVTGLGSRWWKSQKQPPASISQEALDAAKVGWEAYWKSREYLESPYWAKSHAPLNPLDHD